MIAGDINDSGAAETVKNAGGAETGHALKMDVTSEADWKNAVQEAESKFGRLDIVINNAGWSYKNKVSLVVLLVLWSSSDKARLPVSAFQLQCLHDFTADT